MDAPAQKPFTTTARPTVARAVQLFLTPRRSLRHRVPPEGARQLELTSRAGPLHGWELGQGPRVLMVHGWEGDSTQFSRFVTPLLERGHTVTGVDLPAHGATAGKTASAVKFAQALLDAAPQLGSIDAVVAHSLGGAAISLAIAEGLSVQKAVLIAPAAEPRTYVRGLATAIGYAEHELPSLVSAIEEEVGSTFEALDAPNRLAALPLQTRLLVLHDPLDPEVPFSHGERYARLPGARMIPLDGVGHLQILTDPRTVEAAVEFLG